MLVSLLGFQAASFCLISFKRELLHRTSKCKESIFMRLKNIFHLHVHYQIAFTFTNFSDLSSIIRHTAYVLVHSQTLRELILGVGLWLFFVLFCFNMSSPPPRQNQGEVQSIIQFRDPTTSRIILR